MEQSYKEKYEQALMVAKETYDTQPMYREWLEKMFPELAESEDEKVRQKILFLFYSWHNNEQVNIPNKKEVEKAISWLEKQEGCEHIRKEWLEHIKQSWYKEGFIDGKYSGGTSKEWTINDTTTLNELIDFLENGTAKLQHDLTRYANWLKIQFTPIEKQGEQNFEMKTAAESLGVDSETYNKIVDECIFDEQKPAWSEDDEFELECVLGHLRNYLHEDSYIRYENWLKSLKERKGGKI